MLRARQRHDRATVYNQAALVWGLKNVDAESWIERGQCEKEPLRMSIELQQKVAAHAKRIQEAGHFVMPE